MDARLLIDGDWVEAASRAALPILDPSDGSQIGRAPVASADDLDRVLEALARDFEPWSRTDGEARTERLDGVARLLDDRCEVIARTISREQGKILAEARGEVAMSAAIFRYYADQARRLQTEQVVRAPDVALRLIRQPIGPVAIFTPWNFPLVEPAAHVAAALAAGCPIVLKVAEETPLTGVLLMEALLDAGIPTGVVHLVTGDPRAISEHLIGSRVIRKVAFTGSVPVGRVIAGLAGSHLKPCTMELGGNAPVIVTADVDIDATARDLAVKKARNAGQVCTAPNRFYLQQEIHEPFVEAYCRALSTIRLGGGLQPDSGMGPLATARRLAAVERTVGDAAACGAEIRFGGSRSGTSGYFFENTVITGLPDTAQAASEEIFGPVSVFTPFKVIEEAVGRANDTPFGLAAYVFCDDDGRARQIADQLRVGVVGVNQGGVMFPEAPFGGVGDSGWGRICGAEGLAEYRVSKLSAEKAA